MVLHLAGANRDPKVFTDPHRFDIERDNAGKHLSFSGGRHFCLGAALARAEGEVGLRTFFERFPDARLAGTGSRRDTRVLRGWSSLTRADWARRHDSTVVTWISALRSSTRQGRSANSFAPPIRPPAFRRVRTGRSSSCSATSGGETGGPRRSSPTERDEALDPREVRDGKPPDDPDGRHRLAQRRRPTHPRLGRRRRRRHPGLDVHRSSARALVDPPPAARSDGAPRRRGDRARHGLPADARGGRRRDRRVAGAHRRRGERRIVTAGRGPDVASACHRRRPRSRG